MFLDIGLAVTAGAGQNALEQAAMDGRQHGGREGECVLGEQTRDAGRHAVSLVGALLLAAAVLGLVVGGDAAVHLVDTDVALDVFLCRL